MADCQDFDEYSFSAISGPPDKIQYNVAIGNKEVLPSLDVRQLIVQLLTVSTYIYRPL